MTSPIARVRVSEPADDLPATTAPADPYAGRVEPLAANLGHLSLSLPWPSRDLSPNGRVHWARKAKAAKSARVAAHAIARSAGWHLAMLPAGRLHLWITFHPPTRRLPDDDNMLGRFKAYRDGLADALGIDDARFVSHPLVSAEPRKGGEVRVRITVSAAAEVA